MLNPLMLLGLLGLSVPILIHLINRRRMKPRQFATLEFLDQQDVANAFAPVPRDLLQLLLRLLLLSLFILLMTRLTAPSPTVGPRTVAVVLDNSMSMKRLTADGRSLFETHQEQIRDLVRGMNPGDMFSFTLVGDTVFESTGFTGDRLVIEQAVTNAWVSDGSGRGLYATLEDNLKELRARRTPNAALLVFSDQQLQNYKAHLDNPGLAELLWGTRIQPVFVSDPVPTPPNVELLGADFYPEKLYVGSSGKVTARLYNGSETQQTTVVSLKSGPVMMDSRACSLSAGETAHMEVRQTFGSPIDSAWSVNISDDGFSADNDSYTTVRMLKRRQVLLVAMADAVDSDGTASRYSGADLLATAVNPSEALGEAKGETYISVKRISPMAFEGEVLSLYSLVVLYGLDELDAEVVKDLTGYVRQGGGLYLIADTNVMSSTFNATFAPFLAGFQLADLQEPKMASALDTREQAVEDPLLLDLLRGDWGSINDVVFARYFSTSQAGDARVALKTADGNTLIALADLGKGQVCIQTHSWNVEDTSLPRNLAFVSVAHAILDRLSLSDAEVSDRPDHIRVGDIHPMALSQFRGLGGTVVMKGPRPYSFPMSPESAYISVRDMYVAGIYRATHAGKDVARDRWLAVNRALEESDPAFMSEEQLKRLPGEGKGVVVTSGQINGIFHARRELYPLMMGLVFVALLAETLGSLFFRRKKEAHGRSV